MDVAISGDRSSCLTQELAPGTFLFAVAHGFGRIDGQPVAPIVLSRLRSEFERRTRGRRLRRALTRPKGVTGILIAAFNRINEEVHARSASHEDYITAGCSVTAALLLEDRAYLSHVGSTAAYLARDGYVVSLTKIDAFESNGLQVLTRAIGTANALEMSICSFSLSAGDSLLLSGRRLTQEEIKAGAPAEQLLVVHYTPAEPALSELPKAHARVPRLVTGVLATMLFYALLCIS